MQKQLFVNEIFMQFMLKHIQSTHRAKQAGEDPFSGHQAVF